MLGQKETQMERKTERKTGRGEMHRQKLDFMSS